MENLKKFCGDAKTSKYGFNGKINLNQLFKHLYETTGDKSVLDAFKLLKHSVSGKEIAFVNEWKTKDGKEQIEIKLQVGTLRNPTEYKTHAISLNEWKPQSQQSQSVNKQGDLPKDDMPF
jgi:hypothetical protein